MLIGIFEWLISPFAFPKTPALAPWLSFIVVLIGAYFLERAWNENKIQKGETTREEIRNNVEQMVKEAASYLITTYKGEQQNG